MLGIFNLLLYHSALPIKSGLSSSAAICVLTVRAFNNLYNLNLSTEEEMYLAYKGELMTGSKCGRLDQICAKGKQTNYIEFIDDDINISNIKPKEEINIVFSKLLGNKDTKLILSDLQKNMNNGLLKNALSIDNNYYVSKALDYILNGNIDLLGRLYTDYQKNFDSKVSVFSKELLAPELHTILNDSKLTEYAYGSKGVESQGDGSVQFITKSDDCSNKLINYLKDKYKLDPIKFKIS